jgi:sugar-specific transcriptional regulator TrmB
MGGIAFISFWDLILSLNIFRCSSFPGWVVWVVARAWVGSRVLVTPLPCNILNRYVWSRGYKPCPLLHALSVTKLISNLRASGIVVIEMSSFESEESLVRLLNEEAGLTPYESKAYMALLVHGPLSPQGLNQRTGIPRPRTYDVLNSLIGKGLLMEQPGRPTVYAAVPPALGLKRMMAEFEGRLGRELEEKRKLFERLSSSLSKLHRGERAALEEEEKVWVTRRDNSFIARYSEAIRNVEKEFVVATPITDPPEKEILDAVRDALLKKKSVRVVRKIKPPWPREGIEAYLSLAELGEQQRTLDYDGLRFGIFDAKETVLVFPPEDGAQLAVWIKMPQLTEIMYERFEALWKISEPALPLLKRLAKELR